MAQFNKSIGIELSHEEKDLFRECTAGLGNKNITRLPNLKKAMDENFVGWEVKEPKRNIADIYRESHDYDEFIETAVCEGYNQDQAHEAYYELNFKYSN